MGISGSIQVYRCLERLEFPLHSVHPSLQWYVLSVTHDPEKYMAKTPITYCHPAPPQHRKVFGANCGLCHVFLHPNCLGGAGWPSGGNGSSPIPGAPSTVSTFNRSTGSISPSTLFCRIDSGCYCAAVAAKGILQHDVVTSPTNPFYEPCLK